MEEAVREEVTAEMRELIIQIEAEYKVSATTASERIRALVAAPVVSSHQHGGVFTSTCSYAPGE